MFPCRIIASLMCQKRLAATIIAKALFDDLDAASLFITSDAVIATDPAPDNAFRLDSITDVAIVFATAEGEKCARCWRVTPEVTSEGDICQRCETVVAAVR